MECSMVEVENGILSWKGQRERAVSPENGIMWTFFFAFVVVCKFSSKGLIKCFSFLRRDGKTQLGQSFCTCKNSLFPSAMENQNYLTLKLCQFGIVGKILKDF